MKWFDGLIIGGICCLLLLTGCVQTAAPPSPVIVAPAPVVPVNGTGTTLTKLQELIIDIREYTEKGYEGLVRGCGFIPTEGFLMDMLAKVAFTGDAISYAREICAAVTAPLSRNADLARRRGGVVRLPVYINGVQIRGVFVR